MTTEEYEDLYKRCLMTVSYKENRSLRERMERRSPSTPSLEEAKRRGRMGHKVAQRNKAIRTNQK